MHIGVDRRQINQHIVRTTGIRRDLAGMDHRPIRSRRLVVEDHVRIRTNPAVGPKNQRHQIDIDRTRPGIPPDTEPEAGRIRIKRDILTFDKHSFPHRPDDRAAGGRLSSSPRRRASGHPPTSLVKLSIIPVAASIFAPALTCSRVIYAGACEQIIKS